MPNCARGCANGASSLVWRGAPWRTVESSERLGRFRWVAEWTFSLQQGARRLRVRDERRDDIYRAFVQIENAMISWGRLNGHYW
jgi:hypothetical protein